MDLWQPHHYRQSLWHWSTVGINLGLSAIHSNIGGLLRSRGRFHWLQAPKDFCLHVTLEGCGLLTVDGQTYAVGAEQAFLFWPGMRIDYRDAWASQASGHNLVPWRYLWLSLRVVGLSGLFASLGLNRRQPYIESQLGQA